MVFLYLRQPCNQRCLIAVSTPHQKTTTCLCLTLAWLKRSNSLWQTWKPCLTSSSTMCWIQKFPSIPGTESPEFYYFLIWFRPASNAITTVHHRAFTCHAPCLVVIELLTSAISTPQLHSPSVSRLGARQNTSLVLPIRFEKSCVVDHGKVCSRQKRACWPRFGGLGVAGTLEPCLFTGSYCL